MLKSILVAVALCGLPLRAQDTPQRPATLESAVARSIEILLDVQEGEAKDQWPYEGVYRYPRREIPIGYRCGGTSIAATALLETPGHDSDPRRLAAVERATRFVLSCLEHPLLSSDFRGTYDVRGWGHAYALTFLLKVRAHGGLQEDLATRIERAVD
ncbi:MAG: hypothetical protein KDB53_19765, partial [Planctomycetes bacterium]|nr:hypothetical protein [Planctomycetota bacterium]